MASSPRMLIPMLGVKSVAQSIAFYAKLGFRVRSTNVSGDDSHPTWAMLEGDTARLMVTQMINPPTEANHGVVYYLYFEDIEDAYQTANAAGLNPGPLMKPFYCPKGEFQLTDPDGHSLMVTHT